MFEKVCLDRQSQQNKVLELLQNIKPISRLNTLSQFLKIPVTPISIYYKPIEEVWREDVARSGDLIAAKQLGRGC